MQPVILDQHVMELFLSGHGLGGAEEIRNADVGEVPATLDQFDVGVGNAPKNSPRQAQGRPGSDLAGATTMTLAPSIWKSCRVNPFHFDTLPGKGLGSPFSWPWHMATKGPTKRAVNAIKNAGFTMSSPWSGWGRVDADNVRKLRKKRITAAQ